MHIYDLSHSRLQSQLENRDNNSREQNKETTSVKTCIANYPHSMKENITCRKKALQQLRHTFGLNAAKHEQSNGQTSTLKFSNDFCTVSHGNAPLT